MERREEYEGFRIKEEVLVAKRAKYGDQYFENPRQGSLVVIKYFTADGDACVQEVGIKRRTPEYLISVECLEHLAPSDDEIQQTIDSILNKKKN